MRPVRLAGLPAAPFPLLCRPHAAQRPPARRLQAGNGQRALVTTAAAGGGKQNPTRWAVFSAVGFCLILAHGACSAACSWCAGALWFRLIRWLGLLLLPMSSP